MPILRIQKGVILMIIKISESKEATKMAQQYTSKLKNMNLHLREILAKKARLELEIKTLKKSIKEKQENYEKSLRVKLSLEASKLITPEEFSHIQQEDPLLAEALIQLEDADRAINETLLESEILN